jgi:hypothetical protein
MYLSPLVICPSPPVHPAFNKTLLWVVLVLLQKIQVTPQKWATFTYPGKEVRRVTGLFCDANVKVAFYARNTVGNTISKRSIYQLKMF